MISIMDLNKAACAASDVNPEWFFSDSNDNHNPRFVRKAKQVCMSCEIKDLCLSFSIQTNQQYGIWGGLTAQERRQLKARSKRKKGNEERT